MDKRVPVTGITIAPLTLPAATVTVISRIDLLAPALSFAVATPLASVTEEEA